MKNLRVKSVVTCILVIVAAKTIISAALDDAGDRSLEIAESPRGGAMGMGGGMMMRKSSMMAMSPSMSMSARGADGGLSQDFMMEEASFAPPAEASFGMERASSDSGASFENTLGSIIISEGSNENFDAESVQPMLVSLVLYHKTPCVICHQLSYSCSGSKRCP